MNEWLLLLLLNQDFAGYAVQVRSPASTGMMGAQAAVYLGRETAGAELVWTHTHGPFTAFVGGVHFLDAYPAGGTRWNYTLGARLEHELGEGIVFAEWHHWSNGRKWIYNHGHMNPSYDAIMAGYGWRF
jgi:hypothetical protein